MAALLRQTCLVNKSSRVFFLLEEIDEKIKRGNLTDAYFVMQDLHYYCEHHKVEVRRSTADWLALKEAFILLISRCMVDSSYCGYNRPEGIRLPSYYAADLPGIDWIIRSKDGKHYLNKAGISTDGMHEILLNYQQKLIDLLTPISKTLAQLIPDLNAFLWDVIDNVEKPSASFDESIVLAQVDDCKAIPDQADVVAHEERLEKTAFQKAHAQAFAEKQHTTLSIHKKIKPDTSTPLLEKQKLLNELAGVTVQSNSSRSVVDEIYKTMKTREKVMAFLLEVSESLTPRNHYHRRWPTTI